MIYIYKYHHFAESIQLFYLNNLTYMREQGIIGDLTPEWCQKMIDAWFCTAATRIEKERE